MATKKTIPQKIEKIYDPTGAVLAGAAEIKEFLASFKKVVEKSGYKPRSKEMLVYKEVLSDLARCVDLLERNEVDSYDFSSEEALKLKQAATRYLIKNTGIDQQGCLICANFIQDVEKSIQEPQYKTKPTNDPARDASVLAAVENAIKWSPEGENSITIKEKLLEALNDEKVDHVKYRTDKKGNKKASIFVNDKPMNFDTAKLAAGRALKVDAENPEGKYKKNGFLYLRKN